MVEVAEVVDDEVEGSSKSHTDPGTDDPSGSDFVDLVEVGGDAKLFEDDILGGFGSRVAVETLTTVERGVTDGRAALLTVGRGAGRIGTR